MARAYLIGGVKIYRQSLVKLTRDEKRELEDHGKVVVHRPVEWPLPDRIADYSRATIDPGGTDIWGPGPYLKVPNRGGGPDDEAVNRVFCPWGCPSDRLRITRSQTYLRLAAIDLVQSGPAAWEWQLTLEPWQTSTPPSSA